MQPAGRPDLRLVSSSHEAEQVAQIDHRDLATAVE